LVRPVEEKIADIFWTDNALLVSNARSIGECWRLNVLLLYGFNEAAKMSTVNSDGNNHKALMSTAAFTIRQ